MVYCAPFHRLFSELGRVLVGGSGATLVDASSSVADGNPLIDATIQLLREFAVDDAHSKDWERGRNRVGSRERAQGKGKEREVDRREGEEDGDRLADAFVPTYVYEALKEKKRFDSMRVSLIYL
jgi:ubiquitin carboxyl-terminal hydrolase 10